MYYNDASLDGEAESFGARFRQRLKNDTKEGKTSVYANFGSGDEKAEDMYGGLERVERLRGLKEKWDPRGVFSCYNPVA